MDEEAIRKARFQRVMAAADAGLRALTVLRARRYLDEFPGDDPLNYFVWCWLGKALVDLSRYGEAEKALANALRLCPEGRSRIPLSRWANSKKSAVNTSGRPGGSARRSRLSRKMPPDTSTWGTP